jgi:ribokinase
MLPSQGPGEPGVPSVPARPSGSVTVVGSLNFDHVITVERLPAAGETVSGTGYLAVPGGKGLNQAATAARVGASVAMVGCVGDDASGQVLLQVLSDERISAGLVRTVAGAPSGTALITVAAGGLNTIVVAAGANAELRPVDVRPAKEFFGAGAVALAQLEVPITTVEAAFAIARSCGAVTILNPAPAPGPLPHGLLALVDVLVPNETEALFISGQRTPEEAAGWLVDQGCRSVVLTLGEKGALLARPGARAVVVPGYHVQAVDTTAAGDAFCGALAAGLASGDSLEAAVRRGCAAGAIATTTMGALPSLPTAAQVTRLLGS